jgi:hypothetical protein
VEDDPGDGRADGRPITAPRRSTGTSVRIVVISSGSIIAVPLAWTTRAGSSSQNAGETAAIRVPVLKSAIAVTNTWRVVSRCSRKPVVGMTTASVSRKTVESH